MRNLLFELYFKPKVFNDAVTFVFKQGDASY